MNTLTETLTESLSKQITVAYSKGKNNAKLAKLESYARANAAELELPADAQVFSFSIPAGHTCPGAMECLARANRETGKLTHGKDQKFTCFAAVLEQIYPNVREKVWNNFEALKGRSIEEMANILESNLPTKANIIRVHVAGDFFNAAYFRAWMLVASRNPNLHFYAYTKSIRIWVDNRDCVPANFSLTASLGGRYDSLAAEFALKTAIVVFSEDQAARLGLEIDNDDSHAAFGRKSFALLIHGQQQKGSDASKAVQALKKQKTVDYTVKLSPKAVKAWIANERKT